MLKKRVWKMCIIKRIFLRIIKTSWMIFFNSKRDSIKMLHTCDYRGLLRCEFLYGFLLSFVRNRTYSQNISIRSLGTMAKHDATKIPDDCRLTVAHSAIQFFIWFFSFFLVYLSSFLYLQLLEPFAIWFNSTSKKRYGPYHKRKP